MTMMLIVTTMVIIMGTVMRIAMTSVMTMMLIVRTLKMIIVAVIMIAMV